MTLLEPAAAAGPAGIGQATPVSRPARRCAAAAAALGTAYAGISLVWALGGTWLLDTVGGGLAEAGRAGSPLIITAVWAAVVLKLVGVVLPLAAVSTRFSRFRRPLRLLCTVQAVILVGYGVVLTGAGLLVQANVIPASTDADHWALAWHAYLWDPWFAAWGVLVALTLFLSRDRIRPRIQDYRG